MTHSTRHLDSAGSMVLEPLLVPDMWPASCHLAYLYDWYKCSESMCNSPTHPSIHSSIELTARYSLLWLFRFFVSFSVFTPGTRLAQHSVSILFYVYSDRYIYPSSSHSSRPSAPIHVSTTVVVLSSCLCLIIPWIVAYQLICSHHYQITLYLERWIMRLHSNLQYQSLKTPLFSSHNPETIKCLQHLLLTIWSQQSSCQQLNHKYQLQPIVMEAINQDWPLELLLLSWDSQHVN